MSNRKLLTIRVDTDLHEYLTKNAKKNFTSYVESLIIRGLVLDIDEICGQMIQRAEGVYESAMDSVKNKELESKQEELDDLKKEIEMIEDVLKQQLKLITNFSTNQGVSREVVEDIWDNISEKNDNLDSSIYQKIKFTNRVLMKVMMEKGFDRESLKNLLKEDKQPKG